MILEGTEELVLTNRISDNFFDTVSYDWTANYKILLRGSLEKTSSILELETVKISLLSRIDTGVLKLRSVSTNF